MSEGTMIIQDSPSNFIQTSGTRTLEAAILKEYIKIYSHRSETQRPSFFPEQFLNDTDLVPKRRRSLRSSIDSLIKRVSFAWFPRMKKSKEKTRSHESRDVPPSLPSYLIISLLIWRYLLRWKITMTIPFAVFHGMKFMQPLTVMVPHLEPSTALIRLTIYGDSVYTPQVYHGIGVATVWAVIHLLITFVLARKCAYILSSFIAMANSEKTTLNKKLERLLSKKCDSAKNGDEELALWKDFIRILTSFYELNNGFITLQEVALYNKYVCIRDAKQSKKRGPIQNKNLANIICSASPAADATRHQLKNGKTVLLVTSAYEGLFTKTCGVRVRLAIIKSKEFWVYDPEEDSKIFIGSVIKKIAQRLGINSIKVFRGKQRDDEFGCPQKSLAEAHHILKNGFEAKDSVAEFIISRNKWLK
uniref:Uncharacterized protein n=1 Tax=Tetranychus urticae TaxID=32264 RepID=T1L6F7_TETUR